jgi:hypothetical protein
MTYNTGQIVEALTYNAFATAMNEIYYDSHSNATTLPNAGYGYGQTPPPLSTNLAPGQLIAAIDWKNLFDTMRNASTHQGSNSPFPIPPVNKPAPGDLVAAVTTQTIFDSYLATLKTNSFNLGTNQTTLINEAPTSSGALPWTTQLVYTYSADFGSWNNARYFFNTGGSLYFSGQFNPAVPPGTPDEQAWDQALRHITPFKINYNSIIPGASGNEVTPPAGFYGLAASATPTTYLTMFQEHLGTSISPHYATSYVKLEIKLGGAPGTALGGRIDIRLTLVDGDTFVETKTGATVVTISTARSAAPVPYTGTFVYTPGAFVPT